MEQATPLLSEFPFHSHDKLRYSDLDRQGHVNNAVFSTLLETGRVEFLFSGKEPLVDEGCAFVIANLNLAFRGEITWPGQVDVGTRVVAVGKSSVTMEQGVFQNQVCVATAQSVIVQMNGQTRRSQPFSEAARQRLAVWAAGE